MTLVNPVGHEDRVSKPRRHGWGEGALIVALVVATVAVGWHVWQTYHAIIRVPVQQAFEQQSMLLGDIAALRSVDEAMDRGNGPAIIVAAKKAKARMGHVRSVSSAIRSARAEADGVLTKVVAGASVDNVLLAQFNQALNRLEDGVMDADQATRAQLAERESKLASMRRAVWLLVMLSAASVLGIVWVGVTRARDARRLAAVLGLVREREEALANSRQDLADKTRLLQTTLDTIDQGFAVWDSGYRLIAFNAKCLDLWSYPTGVEVGMPMMHLLRHLAEGGAFGTSAPPEELASRNFDRVIAAGADSHEELTLADGRSIMLRRYPMPEGGHASVYTDVTEERRAAASLEHAKARAEHANKAKSEFLSAMSHELRTPLNAVIGFGQLLRDDTTNPPTERQIESIDPILAAGDHLLSLINEVLDLAKIEAGKIVFDIGTVDVNKVLTDVYPLIEGMAEKRGISITYPHLSDGEAVVSADEKRLRQVLLNLLSNAVKYNREGGAVEVSVRSADHGFLRLSVSDTGPGIPEDKMDNLFRPFNRLGAESSSIEGTGIGLTISRELMESMEGEIGVTSRPGEGATFWIEMPLADSAEGANAPPASLHHVPDLHVVDGSRTVLYIDDHDDSLRLMERAIERLGDITFLTAGSVAAGMDVMAHTTPDLVLIDLMLPDGNGVDLLDRLRDGETTRTLPIIAVSSRAADEEVRKGLEAGFDAYLTKPLDLDRAARIIGGALIR